MAQYIMQDYIIEYEKQIAEVAARTIGEIQYIIKVKEASHAQQFSLKNGLKIFKNK